MTSSGRGTSDGIEERREGGGGAAGAACLANASSSGLTRCAAHYGRRGSRMGGGVCVLLRQRHCSLEIE